MKSHYSKIHFSFMSEGSQRSFGQFRIPLRRVQSIQILPILSCKTKPRNRGSNNLRQISGVENEVILQDWLLDSLAFPRLIQFTRNNTFYGPCYDKRRILLPNHTSWPCLICIVITTVSFTNLDRCQQADYFQLISTTFEAILIFLRQLRQ